MSSHYSSRLSFDGIREPRTDRWYDCVAVMAVRIARVYRPSSQESDSHRIQHEYLAAGTVPDSAVVCRSPWFARYRVTTSALLKSVSHKFAVDDFDVELAEPCFFHLFRR